jgi:hypothetical protein
LKVRETRDVGAAAAVVLADPAAYAGMTHVTTDRRT